MTARGSAGRMPNVRLRGSPRSGGAGWEAGKLRQSTLTISRGALKVEYRQLGGSGFMVPALNLGTGTFGGGNEFFKAWGSTDVAAATRLVDVCLEAGLTMFDSADT